MSERILRLSAPFVAAVCFALLVAAAGSGSTGRTAPGYPVARDQVAKLDPRLGAVVATAAAKGAPAALVSGRRAGIAVHGSDVRVVVSASPGREAAARAAVAATGGTLVASAGSLSEALSAAPEVSGHIDQATIDRLTSPANYLGVAPQMVDRVLKSSAAREPAQGTSKT